jgi:hypothetical protein
MIECDVTAAICLAWMSTQGWTCAEYGYCMMLNGYSTWNRTETIFFSRHHLRNCSALDIGVFGFFNVI